MSLKDHIQFIASDLDGTLLQNHAQSIDDLTMQTIKKILDAGIHFTPASGRQYGNMRRLFAPVADRIDYICENGCVVFSGGNLIHQEIMPDELGHKIIDAILALPDPTIEIMVSGVYTSYLLPKHEDFRHHVEDIVGNDVTQTDDLYNIGEPYFKISYYSSQHVPDATSIKARFSEYCHIVSGGNNWVDIMPKRTTKATAIRYLLEELHINSANTVAFGDEENDREMMQYVGFPVAMDNAIPLIKSISPYHTPTVRDALIRLLKGEEFLKK